ncbi:MAG: TetR/AcrR family transcriptional regulator [Actinomycetota bacterium]|nr:TetR/AcrR family transcriptional regulator [Actinomycetota bacterium]
MPKAAQARGRPRDEALDGRLFTAVRELLVSSGYPALTMDALAARARVGKGAIYRRYTSKPEVVIAALFYDQSMVPDVDTGSLLGDLRAESEGLLAVFQAPIALAALPYLLGELGNAEFQQRAQRRFIATDLERVDGILSRARERGELSEPPDTSLTCAVLLGVAFTWLYVFRWEVPGDLAERMARFVVGGLTG